MKRRTFGFGTLLLLGAGLACEGREITVFDLPTKVVSPGGSGSSGSGGSIAGGGAGGTDAGASAPFEAGRAGENGGTPPMTIGGFPPGGDGGLSFGGKPSGKPCLTKDDCEPGWRCEKQGCDAEVGACEPQPVLECPSEPNPVCGCDGVTYWNDCIRRLFIDAQVDSIGECRATACTCEVGADCGVPYASCSHLLANDVCGHGMGACWVLPPICRPAPPGSKKWRQCLGPDMPLGPCVDTCPAIASQRSHVPTHRDDTCQ
jgi:hypothetical protein